jgi:ribosomal protein S18 acetylase RimI-like enzyme
MGMTYARCWAFLVTDPVYRRRGIASSLALETVRRMDRHGACELHLAVEPSNPARMLYRRLGFEEEDERPRGVGQ